jgi:hypothetical protein
MRRAAPAAAPCVCVWAFSAACPHRTRPPLPVTALWPPRCLAAQEPGLTASARDERARALKKIGKIFQVLPGLCSCASRGSLTC